MFCEGSAQASVQRVIRLSIKYEQLKGVVFYDDDFYGIWQNFGCLR